MTSYSDKLRDPRWQKLRLQVFERDQWKCCACGRGDLTLNVHHRNYFGEPWDAPLRWLETLCEKCHERRTTLNDLFCKVIREATTENMFLLSRDSSKLILFFKEIMTPEGVKALAAGGLLTAWSAGCQHYQRVFLESQHQDGVDGDGI